MKKFLLSLVLFSAAAAADIQPEPLGRVNELPATYPPHWIVVQDGSFFHMSDGKFMVIDADSDDPAGRFKGMFNGSFIAQFTQPRTKPEFYIVETFHSRGNRGERTDVLTIYDKRSLAPIGEVVIPAKRASGMPTKYHVQLIDDEKLAVVYNFTPATSVSVVDIESREFLSEVPIPGCALVYPMAGRAFASICGDGSLLRVQLDESGQQVSAERTASFFDVDDDPLMEKPAIIDGIAYFPSFLGNVTPVDLNGPMPVPAESWSLVGPGDEGWRPGGIALAGSDAKGQLYVMMHPDGYDGSHKDPGVEVWVFDPQSKERVNRIELQLPAITMGLTMDDEPLLMTTNINLEVDIYDATDGRYLRTIGNFGQETAFLLHGTHQ